MSVDAVDDAAGEGDIDRLVKIAQAGLDRAIRASFAAGRETERRRHQGAVEAIKALRDRVNPDDPDVREATYARGYRAAVTDALESLVRGH